MKLINFVTAGHIRTASEKPDRSGNDTSMKLILIWLQPDQSGQDLRNPEMTRTRNGTIVRRAFGKVRKSGIARNMKQNKCEVAGPKRKAPEMTGT